MKIYLLALFNGLMSFSSPCIIPLVPGYLSLLSGFSAREIMENKSVDRKKLFIFSFFFVCGFSVVFSVLGAFSSAAGSFIVKNRLILQKISGLFLFILGLHISGFLRIPFLDYEKRKVLRSSRRGFLSAFITGASFAFGWSPCIGPFLASILMIAANKSVSEGVLLLGVYSMGMGIPFMIVSLWGGDFFKRISSNKKVIMIIERISGFLISVLGILIFFDRFSVD